MNLYRQESEMPRKSFTPEQIIAKLRQIEVLISQWPEVAGRPASRSRAITGGAKSMGAWV